MPGIMLIVFGVASIFFTALNLCFSIRNSKFSNWMLTCALSFIALALYLKNEII